MSKFRSAEWWEPDTLRSFMQRSRLRQLGLDEVDYSRPLIAILESNSEISPCHSHFSERVGDIKRGILEQGGFPLHIPVMSLSEPFQKPTTMLYRNFLAMEVEETLKSYPIDGAVLMGGCDKTTPALIMGAVSADIPSIFFPGGPMLRGIAAGKVLGSGTSGWMAWQEHEAGKLPQSELFEVECGIARSAGHCMTMGTASTMTAVAETMGFALGGSSSIPASDSRHRHMATMVGRRSVELAKAGVKPVEFINTESVRNALVVIAALGGSTNAIIHVLAMARRGGIGTMLTDMEEVFSKVPVLANIAPSGKYLMEDFYYAGGLPAMLSQLSNFIDLDCKTVGGCTLGDQIANARIVNEDVIKTIDQPVFESGSIAILFGSLAPDGAVIKACAASEKYFHHRGKAVVFDNMMDLTHRIHDPNLDVDEDSVLILKNAGPVGAPGMPEWGMLPIPKKLLDRGIRDMVRISDARMSGTAYGTCVLHVAPESAVGGPLALVENGDYVILDINNRRLDLDITEEDIRSRKAKWQPRDRVWDRGWTKLFVEDVTQANEGCDLRFLESIDGKERENK